MCHTAEWYSRDVRALFAHILWALFAHILRVPRGGGRDASVPVCTVYPRRITADKDRRRRPKTEQKYTKRKRRKMRLLRINIVPYGGGDTDAEPSNLSGRQPYMYTASPGFRREGRQRPGVRRISPSDYLSASFMERFNLPFSSVPRNLTLTVSPTFTTSSTFSVRCC